MDNSSLTGQYVRLDPMDVQHAESLAEAAANDALLYRWSPVPLNVDTARRYIQTALAWKQAGTAVPFVVVRLTDGHVIGSTRLWNIEFWSWPEGHANYGRGLPDACEIGYSWLAPSATRTAANTEAKKLLLEHAFESWRVLRVCLHTDVRNKRSQAAIERIGGKFEGILRAHRMAADYTARDSARYSILASEWPAVRERLTERLARSC